MFINFYKRFLYLKKLLNVLGCTFSLLHAQL